MPEYPGNAIPSPGYWQASPTTDDELLASMNGYTQWGVTLKAGQGVLLLGTPLAYETTTKRWVATLATGSNGITTARGFLRQTVDTGSDSGGKEFQNNIVTFGAIKLAKVTAAIAAVSGAKALADVLVDVGGRQDTVFGIVKF